MPSFGDDEVGKCTDENVIGRVVVRGTKGIELLISSGTYANGGNNRKY